MTRTVKTCLYGAIFRSSSLLVCMISAAVWLGSIIFMSSSFAADDGNFFYDIEGSNAAVTGCVGACPADLVIPDIIDGYRVTKIAPRAFRTQQLISVTIPDSVIRIGNSAFYNNQISHLVIGNSVTSIGDYAFNRNQLSGVNIPDSVTSIGFRAFIDNPGVSREGLQYFLASTGVTVLGCSDECSKNIVIPSKIDDYHVTNIASSAFVDKKLSSVVIPNGVKSIGNSAFSYNQLTSVAIPDSVGRIGSSAFSNNELVSVTISDNVTFIGESAFSNNLLVNVIIPDSVTSINEHVFYKNKLTNVTIGKGVTRIGNNAFQNNLLITVTIPDSVEIIDYEAFRGNRLVSVNIGKNVTYIGHRAFENNRLTSLIIPDSVTRLGERVFRSNHLSSLTLSKSLSLIPEYAFANNRLTSVVIPDSVIEIDTWAFSNNYLESLTIPDTVKLLGWGSFENNNLNDLVIGSSDIYIGGNAFKGNQLIGVVIPENVRDNLLSIANDVFSDNPGITNGGLKYFVISGSAMVIGCADICPKDLNIPATINGYTVSKIANFALTSAELTSVVIPDTVTRIGISAFRDNQLTSLVIGKSVVAIDDNAFQINKLSDVNIPDSVTSIGMGAFADNKLTSVIIPDSVTSIGSGAFENNQISSVDIPDSVVFNKSVINRVDYAFYNNLGNRSGAVQYFLVSGKAHIIGCADVCPENLVIPSAIEGHQVIKIGKGAFLNQKLTSVVIPESITSIGSYAFVFTDSVTGLLVSNALHFIQFLGDRPLISGKTFYFDSLNPVTITYCSDKDGWPGNAIAKVKPSNDCNGEIFANDNDADGISNDLDNDDDNDGLLDSYEITLSTNPLLVDSDFDGLSDSYEVANQIDPNVADSDNDGLIDGTDYYPLTFDQKDALYSERLIVLPDLNNDGVKEFGIYRLESIYRPRGRQFITLDIRDGKTRGYVSGFRGSLEWRNYYINTTVTLHVIPDRDDNGVDEIALFGITKYGSPEMTINDMKTGRDTGFFRWPTNWTMASVLVLDDMTGDGLAEVAIQGRFKEGNRPQLFIKASDTRERLDTYSYPDLLISPQYYQHSDINGDGFAEIATFGRLRSNNKIQVKLASGIDANNKLPTYNFPDKWDNISWHRLDDSNGDGQDDWGLFGRLRKDGRPQLVNRNGVNQEDELRIYSWPAEMQDAHFYRIPDMNNDGVDEVAAAGRRSNNGRYQLQIKDGADRNITLANHNLNLKLTNVTYHVLPDLTGDEKVEIGFMGIKPNGEYELVIQHGDTLNGEFARHNLGRNWQKAPAITSLGDTDNDGLPDLFLYGHSADGELRLEDY